MREYPSFWDESEDAISDAFVLGDEDTFLDVGYAMERLRTLHYSTTEAAIIVEGWIVDALIA